MRGSSVVAAVVRQGACLAIAIGLGATACGGSNAGSKGDNAGASGSAPTGGAGTSGVGTSGAGTSALDSFPREYAEALCDLFGRCWQAFAAAYESTDQSCASALELMLRERPFNNVAAAVADGRVQYRAENARACLDAVSSLSCEDTLAIDASACEGLFVGFLEPGADCTLDAECADGMQCKVGTGCPGTCAPRARIGEPCTEENRCESGLLCSMAATDEGTCVMPKAPGESCSSSSPCSTFYTCLGLDSGDANSTGTCEPRDALFSGKLGDACAFGGAPGVLCEPNLVCEHGGQLTGVCREPVGSGEACVMALPEPCPAGEYCRITSLTTTPYRGVCSKSPSVGEACDNPGGLPVICPVNAYCSERTGLCEPLKRSGETCTVHDDCFSDACVNQKCTTTLECEPEPT